MNSSVYWRLFWKEYRLQRALWIAMAVMTALIMLLIFEFVENTQDRLKGLLWIALAMPAFYSLGCGATLFAGEKDNGTFEFQRSLPIGAGRLFFAKMLFAIASTSVMFGAMWLLAECFGQGGILLLDSSEHVTVWMLWGFFGLEILLWTVLFSLLSRRVLLAAILGVTFASLSVNSITPLINPQSLDRIFEVMPYRVSIAAVLALADFLLGAMWFRERSDRSRQAARSASGTDTSERTAAFSPCCCGSDRWTILRRLVWQHWRQSRRIMIVIGILLVALTYVAIKGIQWGNLFQLLEDRLYQGGYANFSQELLGIVALLLMLMGIPVLGTCAFSPDQRRESFRFLADRGVTPKCVWLSRQLLSFAMPVGMLLAILLAVVLIFIAMIPGPLKHWDQELGHWDDLAVTANSPFLWAVGSMVKEGNAYSDKKLIPREYVIYIDDGSSKAWVCPNSENDLIRAGLTYPIP